jgi:putative glycosyltransferase (TIGR04348 family)
LKPAIAIITPTLAATNSGNWHTAARWARFLRPEFRVSVAASWDGAAVDALIALHARRSADSVERFAAAYPGRALIVVLTGTDLYRDLDHSAAARRSLELASRLVVLNTLGARRLPRAVRPKTGVILQSAPALAPGHPPRRAFRVAVVGHLRDEKNPQLVWRVANALDPTARIDIRHAGAALDPALARRAERASLRPGYRWLGDLPRARARQLIRASHVLLHPSHMEGGAQAVIEAITAGVPVIASRIDGNVGLLGPAHPGLFRDDAPAAAAALIERAAREPRFLARLRQASQRLAARFRPERERAAVVALVRRALRRRG